MKITVLGSGGAFATMQQGNSAFLVEHQDRRILIDCGTTVPYVLRDEMGIPLQSVTDVIITHAHGDHLGGLEMLLLSHRWMANTKPDVWATAEVCADIRLALAHLLHESDGNNARSLDAHYANIIPFATHVPSILHLAGLPLRLRPVTHVGRMPASSVELGPLFISGDTRSPVFPEGDVRLIFHEAEFGFATGVHVPVDELRAEYDVFLKDHLGELALYHCPQTLPDTHRELQHRVLTKGQVFELDAP